MHHSNVVPTTPIAAPSSGVGGFGTGPGPMQLHSKRGSGQVGYSNLCSKCSIKVERNVAMIAIL